MNRWLLRVLLALYPSSWRKRYGAELRDLIGDLDRNRDRSQARIVTNLVAGAVQERARGLRASTARGGAALAVMTAVVAAVALVTISASGRTTGGHDAQTVTNGAAVYRATTTPRIEHQLQATIQTLCTQAAAGRRVTAIELDPTTGAVVGKIVHTCGTQA